MPNAAFTAAACRIARIERQKFNDVMASGEYTCAPKAQSGYPRIFEMPDLMGLFLFARLIERGRTVKQAAQVACYLVNQVRNRINAIQEMPTHVAVAHDLIGNTHISSVLVKEKDGSDGFAEINPFANFTGPQTPVLWTEMWNVTTLKAEVEKGLAEEARIAGGADEE